MMLAPSLMPGVMGVIFLVWGVEIWSEGRALREEIDNCWCMSESTSHICASCMVYAYDISGYVCDFLFFPPSNSHSHSFFLSSFCSLHSLFLFCAGLLRGYNVSDRSIDCLPSWILSDLVISLLLLLLLTERICLVDMIRILRRA